MLLLAVKETSETIFNEFYEITYTILFNLLLYTFKKLVQVPLGREDGSLGLLP